MPLQFPEWMADAACRDQGLLDLFFPDPGASIVTKNEANRAAKQVCARCPVEDDCLDFALRQRIKEGTWGGLSETERKAMTRVRRAS